MDSNNRTIPAIRLLLQYLEQEGVRYIFGIPGGPIMPLYEALYDRGTIQPILTKHEEGAAFMADGYARVSGKIGVCCTTTGPGATNALTGVAVAYADHIPLLLLTAQAPTHQFGKGAFQESSPETVDIVSLFRPVTKWSTMIHHPDSTASTIRKALRLLHSGRPGPVHINLPLNFVTQRVPNEVIPSERYCFNSQTFDRNSVRESATHLLTAQRPAILAGHGVNLARAWSALRELAERFQIPVATTFKAKGAFPEDHPLSLGVFSYSGDPRVREYIADPRTDVLLVVGTSLGEVSSCGWDERLARKKAFLQIDIDPAEIGRNYPVNVALEGHAETILREIRFQMERELQKSPVDFAPRRLDSGRPAPCGPVDDADLPVLRDPAADLPRLCDSVSDTGSSGSPEGPLKPRHVLKELREALPRDAILFVDNGTIRTWAGQYFPVYREGCFFVNMGLASMGYAVAGSVGGKLADPKRPVVALVGDAAFAMNGMEVHTAVEHDVPVIWVVVNNGGHGMIYHGERLQFHGKFRSSIFHKRLEIMEIAKAMGAASFLAERPGELGRALREAARRDVPCVIEVTTDLYEVPPMGSRVQALDKELAASHPSH